MNTRKKVKLLLHTNTKITKKKQEFWNDTYFISLMEDSNEKWCKIIQNECNHNRKFQVFDKCNLLMFTIYQI